MGGWVCGDRKIEEIEAVRMSYCGFYMGGWWGVYNPWNTDAAMKSVGEFVEVGGWVV